MRPACITWPSGTSTVIRGMGGAGWFTRGVEASLGSTWTDGEMEGSPDCKSGSVPKEGERNCPWQQHNHWKKPGNGQENVRLHMQVFVAIKWEVEGWVHIFPSETLLCPRRAIIHEGTGAKVSGHMVVSVKLSNFPEAQDLRQWWHSPSLAKWGSVKCITLTRLATLVTKDRQKMGYSFPLLRINLKQPTSGCLRSSLSNQSWSPGSSLQNTGCLGS